MLDVWSKYEGDEREDAIADDGLGQARLMQQEGEVDIGKRGDARADGTQRASRWIPS